MQWDSRKLTPAQRLESLAEKGQKRYKGDFTVPDRELEKLHKHLEEEAYKEKNK